MQRRGLRERLDNGGVICAEGYLFEMERRGYLTAGEFMPEVALAHPEALLRLHKDFQHAGSDVMQAFTYNAHREKLRIIEKEDLLEKLNRAALQIAREVAADVPAGQEPNLVAGNISNSNIWACAAEPRRFTFGRSPKPWGVSRPLAVTRPTCANTSCMETTIVCLTTSRPTAIRPENGYPEGRRPMSRWRIGHDGQLRGGK